MVETVSKDDENVLRQAILKLALRMNANSSDNALLGAYGKHEKDHFVDGVLNSVPMPDLLYWIDDQDLYDTDVLYYQIIHKLWHMVYPTQLSTWLEDDKVNREMLEEMLEKSKKKRKSARAESDVPVAKKAKVHEEAEVKIPEVVTATAEEKK